MAEGKDLSSSLKIVVSKQDNEEGVSDQQICNICLLHFAKYTCPRCNIRYCSLSCYKDQKHGQCSESFYRDCFLTELKQQKRSPEDKQRVLEMLKRLEEQSDSDTSAGCGLDVNSDPTESLEERLAGLDLDKEIDSVWQKLTPLEQKEFEEAVKTGRIGHLIVVYTPWWEGLKPLVSEKDTAAVDSQPSASTPPRPQPQPPALLTDLPPLNTLIKSGNISPCLRYNILNVLYAYVYTVRLFNGDHHELCLQASQALLDISGCLSSNASFSSIGEALHHAMTTVKQNKDLFSSNETCLSAFKDVSSILCHQQSHDCHVIQALSDVHKLLGSAKAQLKSTSKVQGAGDAAASKRIWLARKKVYFFIVFSNEFADDLSPLSKVVDIKYETERKAIEEERQLEREQGADRRKPKEASETKKLIEELS